MTAEEKYVAAAYLVVFLFVLVYVVIMAAKLSRLQREIGELADRARARRDPDQPAADGSAREEMRVG